MAARKTKPVQTEIEKPLVSEPQLRCLCDGLIGRTPAARILCLRAMLNPGSEIDQHEMRNGMKMAAFEVEEGLRDLRILITNRKLNNFNVDWENQTLTYTGGEVKDAD